MRIMALIAVGIVLAFLLGFWLGQEVAFNTLAAYCHTDTECSMLCSAWNTNCAENILD